MCAISGPPSFHERKYAGGFFVLAEVGCSGNPMGGPFEMKQ